MLSPPLQQSLPSSSLCYSFSSHPFVDFLEEFHGSYEEPIKVLVLSCGDLFFAVHNTSLCSKQKIENITLTDGSAIVVARNVLFAKIITDITFDPNNEDDLQYLWNICYNMEWSSKTLQRFLKDITELKEGKISANLKIPVANDMDTLKNIWDFWILSASNVDLASMETFRDQRYESIIGHIHGTLFPEKQTPIPTQNCKKPALSAVWEWMFTQSMKDNTMDLSHLPDYHTRAITEEMRVFFETGNCCKTQEIKICINPMLLNPSTGKWGMAPFISPFEAYLNISQLPVKSDLLSACKSVLGNQVRSYQKWLFEENSMSFHIGDAFELCYRKTWTKAFNIVDCSKLSDRLGLANILNAARIALADNSHAIISTHSSPWRDTTSADRYPSTKEFVEDSLRSSIQMFPTLYGLTLMNHVRLGNPSPLRRTWRASVRLQWKKSPCFTDLRIALTGAIEQFFQDLQLVCFKGPESRKTNIFESFTPLTYCYFLSSFTERVELSESDRTTMEQPPCLQTPSKLGWNTLLAWMKGEEIFHLSVKLTPIATVKEEGHLRLILATQNYDNVQFIDNFGLACDGNDIVVKFMLLRDHHLKLENMIVYLARDTITTPVTSSCPLTDASFTDLSHPMPFTPKVDSNSFLTCLEFEDFYCIGLTGVSHEDLVLSSDRQAPSEAGHKINMTAGTLSQCLTFPWPLKISEVHSSSELEADCPRLILPKSLNEPHPYEWIDRKQWDLSLLNPWDTKTLLADLNFHLSAQFDFRELKRQMLDETNDEEVSCVKGIREIIRTLFQSVTIDGNLLFVIRSKHDPKLKNLWFLRAHLPVLISPFDSPMLLLTANDHRLAQKLVDRGDLEQTQATEDFKRIFVEGIPSSQVCPLFVQSEQEEEMLRYVLRLNATKIVPNNWPIEQVPVGENSPWLSTFVSPLYVDQTGTDADMEDLVVVTNRLSIKPEEKNVISSSMEPIELKVCSKCKQMKENLKRCSRCKSVKYCSRECQRSDWESHKSLCS